MSTDPSSENRENIIANGYKLIGENKLDLAEAHFEKAYSLATNDINILITYAQILLTFRDENKRIKARDIVLKAINLYPDLLLNNNEAVVALLRQTAFLCHASGKLQDAINIFKKISETTKNAYDFFSLSNALIQNEKYKEGLESLKKSILIDPANFSNLENNEKIKLIEKNLNKSNNKEEILLRKYPDTQKITQPIKETVISELIDYKILRNSYEHLSPCVFMLGACFHHEFSRKLDILGCKNHMINSHEISTTSSNKRFFEWLLDSETHADKEALNKMFPEGGEILKSKLIESTHVFLSYTSAFEFIINETNLPVLKAASILNIKWQSENYNYQLTSVENCTSDIVNTIHLIRLINPKAIIYLQISPTPIHSSVGEESSVSCDFLSKSTLRLSIHNAIQLKKDISSIFYWPTIETFRWIPAHQSGFYGGTDGSAWHVNVDVIDQTAQAFYDICCKGKTDKYWPIPES